ncbi:response regulator [Niabella drilacis]|uniref:Two component transcriptional regulator, LuxR family n=1 Tax=Niabella drilacis (strain DSM 25811 / CCM 8410 / CCUG 62505 / LMG 26954 / E90) TaxID=1285928 RepID=A0A1G6XYH4_NIADE|nr:response regulator transcription factor [Niabella drilacis]SDD82445.1 two component transcriptional regulator, LuxR family [Niabella drilacis]
MNTNLYQLINCCIIEDDEVIRNGYVSLLSADEDFFVSGDYASAEAALEQLDRIRPDVILLDIQLPGMRGVDALPAIRKILPGVHIIMLTVHESDDLVFTALKNGASGYLTKNTSFNKIKEHIRDVIRGGGAMSTEIALQVMKYFQKNQHSPLTKRETEILECVAEGKSRSKIAQELFIDQETVKSHIKNIYHKLDVNSRAEALSVARKSRFI